MLCRNYLKLALLFFRAGMALIAFHPMYSVDLKYLVPRFPSSPYKQSDTQRNNNAIFLCHCSFIVLADEVFVVTRNIPIIITVFLAFVYQYETSIKGKLCCMVKNKNWFPPLFHVKSAVSFQCER